MKNKKAVASDKPATLLLRETKDSTPVIMEVESLEMATHELIHGVGVGKYVDADVKQDNLFIVYAYRDDPSQGWKVRRLSGLAQKTGERAG